MNGSTYELLFPLTVRHAKGWEKLGFSLHYCVSLFFVRWL